MYRTVVAVVSNVVAAVVVRRFLTVNSLLVLIFSCTERGPLEIWFWSILAKKQKQKHGQSLFNANLASGQS